MDNKFEITDSFGDCDPADCNMKADSTPLAPELIAPLNTNFTEYPATPLVPDGYMLTETAEEYMTPPDAPEFVNSPDEFSTETAKEFDTQATDKASGYHSDSARTTDLSGAYGEEQDEYTEAAEDFDGVRYNTTRNGCDGDGCDIDGDCGCGDGCGCGYTDPSDELAATTDELYTTTCACGKCALDDYEIISDVLGSEKQLVKLYSTALCEAAEEPFRNIIRENLSECAADQYKTFEFMESRGMYPTEQADEEQVTKAKQQFTPLCDNHR